MLAQASFEQILKNILKSLLQELNCEITERFSFKSGQSISLSTVIQHKLFVKSYPLQSKLWEQKTNDLRTRQTQHNPDTAEVDLEST